MVGSRLDREGRVRRREAGVEAPDPHRDAQQPLGDLAGTCQGARRIADDAAPGQVMGRAPTHMGTHPREAHVFAPRPKRPPPPGNGRVHPTVPV